MDTREPPEERKAGVGLVGAPVAEPGAINLAWLIRMRWAATAGQLVAIVVVDRLLSVSLPIVTLLAVVGVGVVPNLVYAAQRRRGSLPSGGLVARLGRWPSRVWSALLMILDTVLLTALLSLTGGPFNPFSFLYLVPIALSAVMLPSRWAWGLVAFALCCFATLFFIYNPLPLAASHADHMRIHTQGMWVAFGVAAAFIVHFLMRVTAALVDREAKLAAARDLADRQKQVAALASLAAGTAHELATPLATVAVAASELERALSAVADAKEGANAGQSLESARADARLIRQQLQHCREILDRMSLAGGEFVGERLTPVRVRDLIDQAVAKVAGGPVVQVLADEPARETRIHVPPNALAEGLRCLIRNAQEVSPAGESVVVRASVDGGWLDVSVEDRGPGMFPDVLARAGEPFFTTKPTGAGMGLGLFVTRSLVERLGGHLGLASTRGRGTKATIRLFVAGASAAPPA